MHPNAAFRMADDPLALVARLAFAHLFAVTPDGPGVAHAPVLVRDGRLWFHLANGNALTRHLAGQPMVASVATIGSYISPNWYGGDMSRHVPTWNYEAVEVHGIARAQDRAELLDLLDLAAATFEPRVGEDWTMAKMDPARRDAMLGAITGFVLVPTTIRTTRKASQNRPDADARGVIAGLTRTGDTAGAALVASSRGWA